MVVIITCILPVTYNHKNDCNHNNYVVIIIIELLSLHIHSKFEEVLLKCTIDPKNKSINKYAHLKGFSK